MKIVLQAPDFGNWHGPSAYSPYQGSSWMWPPHPPWGWSGVPPVSPSPYFPQLSTTSASPLPFYPQSSATPAASATRPYFPQSSESSPDPFKVCVKTGNISICNGCQNNFSKNDVIVIQHPKFRQFNSPRTGLPTKKYGNAYYHPRIRCIELKWGANVNVIVSDQMKSKLTPPQKDELMKRVHNYFKLNLCV